MQYEHLVKRKRLTCYLADEKKIREELNKKEVLCSTYLNKGVEQGSSVVTRELHHDGESFGSSYRMTQENLKLSPFLNKQDLYVIDCSPTGFTVFASRPMLTLTGTMF